MIKDNWLNTVSSGTYKFTFYVVSRPVMNLAITTGEFNEEQALSSGQAVIIAEDGVEGAYAIQNVMIKTVAGAITNGYARMAHITCDLLEPLGFGLLDRLLTVGPQLGPTANIQNLNYILKLDFLGRDPISGASVKFPDPFIYPVKINAMTGSLGEAGAKYFLELSPMDSVVAQEDTVVPTDVEVTGVTDISSFVTNLEEALNKHVVNTTPTPQIAAGGQPITYKVVLDSSATIEAVDYLNLPSFDLSSAAWAGTSDSDTSGGQSENLESLGVRDIIINNETQLTAKIRELIALNTPSFAAFNENAKQQGITHDIVVEATTTVEDSINPVLNVEKKQVELRIKIITDHTATPPENRTIQQLRNSANLQEQRFRNTILPALVKKYSYQYTGENSEVMDIDLQILNTFFNARDPMAGIYYADNNNMFEANIEPADSIDLPDPTATPEDNPPGAGVRYLSDVKLQKFNINQSPVFRVQTVGAGGQQVNETTSADRIANLAAMNHASRLRDAQNLTLEVRGDPIFCGKNGKSLFKAYNNSIYMAFINFQPEPEDLLIRQQRGPIDLITTGIYKIQEITSKFQQGSFTQTITTLKDQNSTTFLILDTLINLEVE